MARRGIGSGSAVAVRYLDAEAALRAARVEVGGTERVKEEARSGGWEQVVESPAADVKYGARSLRRNPAFWGANVTVAYKEVVIPLLDDI